MQPSINESDRVVVFNWAYLFSQPKSGDVVVFRGSDGRGYVKRIAAVTEKGEFLVEGDNKGDSRKLPPVRRSAIIGRVVGKY
ncbi:S26 family signal peptidase [Candidatus Woesearchaeota archaeon]|nr:S26 family signal peptidase [Candidatus Woesearchaeota archaeon]